MCFYILSIDYELVQCRLPLLNAYLYLSQAALMSCQLQSFVFSQLASGNDCSTNDHHLLAGVLPLTVALGGTPVHASTGAHLDVIRAFMYSPHTHFHLSFSLMIPLYDILWKALLSQLLRKQRKGQSFSFSRRFALSRNVTKWPTLAWQLN